MKVNTALAHARGIDLKDPALGLRVAAERLSTVRYVFLVQVEDGIATASQRAALEYADAVLIGWPDDQEQIRDIDESEQATVRHEVSVMESNIAQFSTMEREADVEGMADRLVRVCECVAEIRKLYQPSFPLPTFAEIHRVVQEEWNEEMGRIDTDEPAPTAESIEQETQHEDKIHEQRAKQQAQGADEHAGGDEHAGQARPGGAAA